MATPTNAEQELLELVNRARMDPSGEVDRLILDSAQRIGADPGITNGLRGFNVDIDNFRADMEARDPVAPLAWNSNLGEAAERHSNAMIRWDQQSHKLPDEQELGDRASAAGVKDWAAVGENVFAFSQNPLDAHGSFIIDWGNTATGQQQPAGHRDAILSADYTEIGIDATADNNAATAVGPLVVTQEFARTWNADPQLVGVAFRDKDGDNFYDAGEGLGGQTVTLTGATGTFTTTTWDSGGYQLKAPAGDYKVTFSGAGAEARAYDVTIANENVHLNNNVALPADSKPADVAATTPKVDPVETKTETKTDATTDASKTDTTATPVEEVAATCDTDCCFDDAEMAALVNSLMRLSSDCGQDVRAIEPFAAMQTGNPFDCASATAGFDTGCGASGCGQAAPVAWHADAASCAQAASPYGLINDCMFA